MITQKISERKALLAKLAQLDQVIDVERDKELAALPEQYGYESPEEFADAVIHAAKGRKPRGQVMTKLGRGKRNLPVARSGPKKRAVITDETRMQVAALVKEGKTGGEIAKAVGISLPSVQNVKKQLGLVAARG